MNPLFLKERNNYPLNFVFIIFFLLKEINSEEEDHYRFLKEINNSSNSTNLTEISKDDPFFKSREYIDETFNKFILKVVIILISIIFIVVLIFVIRWCKKKRIHKKILRKISKKIDKLHSNKHPRNKSVNIKKDEIAPDAPVTLSQIINVAMTNANMTTEASLENNEEIQSNVLSSNQKYLEDALNKIQTFRSRAESTTELKTNETKDN